MKHFSDLLPLAWFGIVVIGVISSIVKSAKRQAAKSSPAQTPAVRVTGVPQGLHAQFAANAAQVARAGAGARAASGGPAAGEAAAAPIAAAAARSGSGHGTGLRAAPDVLHPGTAR